MRCPDSKPLSFCRKTTMVKHQRRSHQRGIHSSELDDCTSESGSDDAPSTPRTTAMHWPPQGVVNHQGIPQGHTIHRAASFADFGQHMQQYNMPEQYNHRHSVSSGGAHEYHGGHPVQQEHPGMQMLHRTASMPQHSYYVTETGNPGVATMNTNPMPPQYQVPRQQVERLPLDIPYSAPGLTASIQSSPSSFSAASGRSPSTQEGFYTHQAPQAATYALHNASPVEQQAPMMQYQQQMPQQFPQQMQQPMGQQPMPQPQVMKMEPQRQAPPPPAPEQYQPAPQPEEWYNGVPYQPPVEVATIGQMPAYGSGVYDPWGGEVKFEDTTIQMPSARIENM